MSWNSADQRLGVVIGVLSGDSYIVKYCGQDGPNYNVIKFPFTYAPSVSIVDSSKDDENVGFVAWNFLRDQLVGRRVLIGESLPINSQPVTIIQLFDAPVSFSKTTLADDREVDIEALMLQNGLTRVRELQSIPEELKVDYQKYVNMGREQEMGTWGKLIRPHGFKARDEAHPFTHKEMLENCEMQVVVTGICDDCFLFQVVTANNIKFTIELAGITHSNIATSSPIIRNLVGMFFVENMLTRTFNLRIHARTQRGYLGTLSTGGRNIAFSMLSKGLARFNEMTSSYLSNAKQMRTFEFNAKRLGKGIWVDTDYSKSRTEKFPANVVSIPSSNTVLIRNYEGDEELFYFSGIHVPEFDFIHKSEPLGYEAWTLIKDTVLGKEVYVTIDDERADKKFATITCGEICINELLAKRGLAVLSVSRVRKNPEGIAKIRDAYIQAQEAGIGIFSEDKPATGFILHNLTEDERMDIMKDDASRNIHAIVIDVTGPVYMRLFVPSLQTVINVSLVGLVPLAPTEWTSRRSQDALRARFLNHDVDVVLTRFAEHSRYFRAIVYDSATHEDARLLPVQYGFVRFNSNVADDISEKGLLEQYAEEARTNQLGVYKADTKGSAPISKDKPIPVIVTKVIDETTLAVQSSTESNSKVIDLLKAQFHPLDITPLPDEYTILERNGVNYRAQVIRTRGQEAYVYLLDFGISVWAFISDLRTYTEELLQYQPNALVVSLAFVNPFTKHSDLFRQAAVNFINNIFVTGTEVFIRRPYDRELPCVQVFLDKEVNSMTLQYALVNDGIVQVAEERVHPSFMPAVNELTKIMGIAKKAGIGGWSIHESQ
jgi:endonuclease YncB( thermonuclease family)